MLAHLIIAGKNPLAPLDIRYLLARPYPLDEDEVSINSIAIRRLRGEHQFSKKQRKKKTSRPAPP